MDQVAPADPEPLLERPCREPEIDDLQLDAGGRGDHAMRPAGRPGRLVAQNLDHERDPPVGRRIGEVGQRLRRHPGAGRQPQQVEATRIVAAEQAGEMPHGGGSRTRQVRGRREQRVEQGRPGRLAGDGAAVGRLGRPGHFGYTSALVRPTAPQIPSREVPR